MSSADLRDVSEAVQCSISEDELAQWHRQDGHRVVQYRGRPWVEIRRAFFQPVHWLARLKYDEIGRPCALALGYRACLAEADSEKANASLPVHLLSDLDQYELSNFNCKFRNQLRKCQRGAQIVELTGPDLLQQYGYDVLVSAVRRAGYRSIPTKEKYLADLARYFRPGRLLLGALINGELKAYSSGFAVDGVAYFEEQYIATDALPSNVGIGMIYEYVQSCRRAGGLHQVVYGLHAREQEKLSAFKERAGFSVQHIPARSWMCPPLGGLLHLSVPHKYYRLTGHV